jgi:hypothetical protein
MTAPAAQAGRHERIARGAHAIQRERAGARAHPVARRDIVLQQDGNAVQRAAHLARLALAVEIGGDLDGIGIQFDDGIQARSGPVDGGDAREVALHERLRRQLAGFHQRLLLAHAGVQHRIELLARCRSGHAGRGARRQSQSNEIPAIHASSSRMLQHNRILPI